MQERHVGLLRGNEFTDAFAQTEQRRQLLGGGVAIPNGNGYVVDSLNLNHGTCRGSGFEDRNS